MQIVINGVELEFELYDTEMLEKYDTTIDSVKNATRKLRGDSDLTMYDQMRGMMLAIRSGFDVIFGDGTGERVCGKTNMSLHMNAYKQLLIEADKQTEAFNKISEKIDSLQADNDAENIKPVRQNVQVDGLPPITDTGHWDSVNNIVAGAFREHSN